MTQSIITRYYGPTNTKPSRISATTSSGRREWHSIRHETGTYENHAGAAFTLAVHLGWLGNWQGAALNDKGDMVWVNCTDSFAKDYQFKV